MASRLPVLVRVSLVMLNTKAKVYSYYWRLTSGKTPKNPSCCCCCCLGSCLGACLRGGGFGPPNLPARLTSSNTPKLDSEFAEDGFGKIFCCGDWRNDDCSDVDSTDSWLNMFAISCACCCLCFSILSLILCWLGEREGCSVVLVVGCLVGLASWALPLLILFLTCSKILRGWLDSVSGLNVFRPWSKLCCCRGCCCWVCWGNCLWGFLWLKLLWKFWLFLLGCVGGGVTLCVGLRWLNLFCVAGFSSGFRRPILIFPANDGIFFLPPSFLIILGTLLSLTVLLLMMASAVLFLDPPLDPGHPSHPSFVSLRSPLQVGYGAQVPSWVQMESTSAPLTQSNLHLVLMNPVAQ